MVVYWWHAVWWRMSSLSRVSWSHRRWENWCIFRYPCCILGLSFSIVLKTYCLELIIIRGSVMKIGSWVGLIVLMLIFSEKYRLTISSVWMPISSAIFRNTTTTKPTQVLLCWCIKIKILFFWFNVCWNMTDWTVYTL